MAILADLAQFAVAHKWALLFYGLLMLIIYLLRARFEWHGIVGLYKTKVGLRLMDTWGKRQRGLVQILGLIGIGVGFAGMLFITGYLIYGLFDLIVNPQAAAVVSPVIPGISIPGAPITVPLITGWIALFVVILVHEFAHGVVARAYDIPIKSSGLLIAAIIGGAFVEPDEKKLPKQPPAVQYSMFAAGPFSNVLLGLAFMLAFAFVLVPVVNSLTVPAGVLITDVTADYPAESAGLTPGMIITSINGVAVLDYAAMSKELDKVTSGETVEVGTEGQTVSVITTTNPANPDSDRGYLGIMADSQRLPVMEGAWFSALHWVLVWLRDFFQWVVLLSFGIGIANLLPMGPVDGGQMLRLACRQITGEKKRADWWWGKISLVVFVLLIVLLVVPIGKAVFGF
jgi:membrane-associated protease RseP (regulator of RpoE activity)